MTANFDAAKSAALAIAMLDWRDHGQTYAKAMVDTAQALAAEMQKLGMPVFETVTGPTSSHQFAIALRAMAADKRRQKPCVRLGSWPVGSVCRLRRLRAT